MTFGIKMEKKADCSHLPEGYLPLNKEDDMKILNESEKIALNEFISKHYSEWLLVAKQFLSERDIEKLEKKLSK